MFGPDAGERLRKEVPVVQGGRRLRQRAVGTVGLGALLAGCAGTPPPRDALQAVLWQLGAAEYRAVALQAYDAAGRSLTEALADTTWTAALEQPAGSGRLPPAVIVDVDETVLDNAAFGVRMVREGREFDPVAWDAWVAEASAPAIPGAVAFLRRADSLGVRVFYVTNRDALEEEGTRRNLARLGFPVDSSTDVVLTRGEREAWGSDKSSRRAEVARRHRVLLLVGDDLNDFVLALRAPAERRELARDHASRWGRSWIVLPNPVYGSWQDALWGFGEAPPEERHRIRMQTLEGDRRDQRAEEESDER